MAIRNLDYECYLDSVKAHHDYQEDWLRTGYAPRGFYLKDFCLFKDKNTYHLFHIAGTPGVSCCLPGNEIWFGHATTQDFLTWETHEPCLYIDPRSWDNGHVFAPYVIARNDQYWMFYTGCAIDNTQRIGAATSADLFHWQRVGDRPVIRPEEYGWAFCPTEHGSACRDPHVMWFDGHYQLYYTAVNQEGHGCVARAWSEDLLNWYDAGPAYAFSGLNHCESSNVQELNGRYVLFFGGHHEYWSYVISDNPLSWPDQAPIKLHRGITAMEVIERHANRWLVCYFKFASMRLYLGVLDWSAEPAQIVEIETADQLRAFEF